MDLREFFSIVEGLKDQENRERAELATKILVAAVVKERTPQFVVTDDENYVAAGWRGWLFSDVPEDLKPVFDSTIFMITAVPPDQQPPGIATFGHDSKMEYDTLTVYFKPPGERVTEDAWGRYCKLKAPMMLQSKFNPIVHEFIHAFDSKRLSDPTYMDVTKYDSAKLMNKDPEEMQKYANEPLEFNGIFQQFAQNMEGKIRHYGLEKMGISNAHDMVKFGYESIPTEWSSKLTPTLNRHLAKRFTQFWYDMKSKYS